MRMLLSILLLTNFFITTQASTLVVCSDCNWKTVKEAVLGADEGDTVLVKKGLYVENQIEIRKSIYLLGEGRPIIDGSGENEILITFADDICIKGFQLQNIGTSFLKDRAAIRLVESKSVLVEDNILRNTFFGIYLQKSDSCIIRNNQIIGNATDEATAGNAIHIWKGDNILVEGNLSTHHRDGMYFEFVNHSKIIGNTCEFNLRYGLHFMFSNQDLYQNNVFKDNGVGVAVMFSRNIQMIENQFEDNWGGSAYGILLKEISDGEMRGNRFLRNTKGIYAEGTNRFLITKNQFIENGWALDIKGNCLDNRFEQNNFISNTFELITNSQQSLNVFKDNYWSHYQGYDLDKDGKGDIPHRPVRLYALLIEKIPAAAIMMHSFMANLLDYSERIFPDYIPKSLLDPTPLMKPLAL